MGARNPARTLSSVDFPQPLGPSSATNSPGAMDSETSSTAARLPAPKSTVTRSRRRRGSAFCGSRRCADRPRSGAAPARGGTAAIVLCVSCGLEWMSDARATRHPDWSSVMFEQFVMTSTIRARRRERRNPSILSCRTALAACCSCDGRRDGRDVGIAVRASFAHAMTNGLLSSSTRSAGAIPSLWRIAVVVQIAAHAHEPRARREGEVAAHRRAGDEGVIFRQLRAVDEVRPPPRSTWLRPLTTSSG